MIAVLFESCYSLSRCSTSRRRQSQISADSSQPVTAPPARHEPCMARAPLGQPAQTRDSEARPRGQYRFSDGQPYVIYEGTTVDTVLMNRLDGDAVGPVKVLVSNPVYSHDHQHVLIPDGTIVLGEAKKIGAAASASNGAWPLSSTG